jgi:hypothetical protein
MLTVKYNQVTPVYWEAPGGQRVHHTHRECQEPIYRNLEDGMQTATRLIFDLFEFNRNGNPTFYSPVNQEDLDHLSLLYQFFKREADTDETVKLYMPVLNKKIKDLIDLGEDFEDWYTKHIDPNHIKNSALIVKYNQGTALWAKKASGLHISHTHSEVSEPIFTDLHDCIQKINQIVHDLLIFVKNPMCNSKPLDAPPIFEDLIHLRLIYYAAKNKSQTNQAFKDCMPSLIERIQVVIDQSKNESIQKWILDNLNN